MMRWRKKSSSPPSPVAGLLVGLLFTVIGLGVAVAGWMFLGARTLEVGRWAQVPCEVTKWEVGIRPASSDVFDATLALEYRYQFKGQAFTGTALNAVRSAESTLNELEETGASIRGNPQVCYVNPADPSQSALLPGGWLFPGAIMGFGLMFAGIGGLVALKSAGNLILRIRGQGDPPSATGEKGCLGLIGTLGGWTVFAGLGLLVWKQAVHDAPDWGEIAPKMRQAPAKVIASGVERRTGSGNNRSTTYAGKVAFTYEFGGRVWHSGWLDFDRGSTSSSNRGGAEAAAARHPVGQATVCWVNPEAPWQAVLEKERGGRWWLGLIAVLFFGIGAAGVAGTLVKGLRRMIGRTGITG